MVRLVTGQECHAVGGERVHYRCKVAPPIELSIDNQIATIQLHRPHRRNAWTGAMHAAYREALVNAEADPSVRAILVIGSGHSFCVGGDMEALVGHVEKGGYDSGLTEPPAMPGAGTSPEFEADFAYHFALTKPVLAAVNGAAAGVGLVLACYADFRFVTPDAKLTMAHGRIGLPAEYGISWLLPRLIGLSRANDLLFTSRIFTGVEAVELGLALRSCDAESIESEARAFLRELIEQNAPASLAATKQQVYRDQHRDVRSAVEHAQALLERLATEEAFAHGVRAFQERRPPRFDQLR